MNLFPAIKIDGEIIQGGKTDSHGTIAIEKGLPLTPDASHGFTPAGSNIFLSRKQAPSWIKQYEPRVFAKLGTLPKEGLHSHIYARAKGIKQRDITDTVDLSTKTCIVFDRGGLYSYRAQDLGKEYGKVFYYIPDALSFPESPKYRMGTGLPEIERINDKKFWKELKKADIIIFPDTYDGSFQNYLREEGHTVLGSGLCEKLEIDKAYFLDALTRVGLPVTKTKLVSGIDDLMAQIDGKNKKWLKGLYRGDFETRSAEDIDQLKNWLDHELVPRLGEGSKTIKILVQDHIKSDAEAGYDGLMIDGECLDDCLIGYEVKDEAYVCKVFDKVPAIIKNVNDKMISEFKKLGPYRGEYSTELRITEDGTAYYTDATCRIPSPPGELLSNICSNYNKATFLVAKGLKPKLTWKAKFGAEIMLTSSWYEKNPLIVKFPEEIYDRVKLKMHLKENGHHTCIPNGNGNAFGAVIAWADTKEKAIEECMKIAEQIQCEEYQHKGGEGTFKKANDAIEAGARHGIDFS